MPNPAWGWFGQAPPGFPPNPYGPPGATYFQAPPPAYYPAPPFSPPPAAPRSPAPSPSGGKPEAQTPPTQKKPPAKSLFIPVSTSVVGTGRGSSGLPRRPCGMGACAFGETHYTWECPIRWAEVLGSSPPGFLPGRPAQKDPTAWSGTEITDETARAWKDLLARHPEIVRAQGVTWSTNFD